MRTTRRLVTFTRPFILHGLDEAQPAGTYCVEIDEEPIEGASMTAYRRMAMWIVLAPRPDRPGIVETVSVDPTEFEQALARDSAA